MYLYIELTGLGGVEEVTKIFDDMWPSALIAVLFDIIELCIPPITSIHLSKLPKTPR